MSGGEFDLFHVLSAKIEDTGAVILAIGDANSKISHDERVIHLQTSGIVSIPPVGAEILGYETSAGYISIAGRDITTGKIAGRMSVGETTVYAPGSQACTLYKRDGSVTHFTTDNQTENGKSIFARVAKTGFDWLCPWAKMSLDEKGYHMLHASGARIDMGGISGMPAPLSQMSSYAKISAKMMHIEASVISLGTTAGVSEPVAKATTLLALLSSLQAEHTAMMNLVTAIAATPAAPGSAPVANPLVVTAAQAFSAAASATAGALSAAVLTLPSGSTSTT